MTDERQRNIEHRDTLPSMPPLAVRLSEAGRLIGISRTALYGLLRSGQLASFQIGGMRLIAYSELERFIAEQQSKGQA